MSADRRDTRVVTFTKARQQKFLAFVEKNAGCTVKDAATHAGVRRWQVRELLESDPAFRAAYDGARGHRRDAIREELWARAMDRSDASSGRLLLKLAEAELPEHAPRQRLEHANADGKPFAVNSFDPDKLSAEQLDQLIALLEVAQPDGK